uniref:Uncharacterized protein n=1 Tax=Sus scrofa TaxID=9823 RepID=A0A8D1DDR5_PIG
MSGTRNLSTKLIHKQGARDLNRPFPKQMYTWLQVVERCQTSRTIKEVQISTHRISPHPIRVAGVKMTRGDTCWGGRGEKGTLAHCRWGCKLVQPSWKTVERFLHRLKLKPPRDAAAPLLGVWAEAARSGSTATPTGALNPLIRGFAARGFRLPQSTVV